MHRLLDSPKRLQQTDTFTWTHAAGMSRVPRTKTQLSAQLMRPPNLQKGEKKCSSDYNKEEEDGGAH